MTSPEPVTQPPSYPQPGSIPPPPSPPPSDYSKLASRLQSLDIRTKVGIGIVIVAIFGGIITALLLASGHPNAAIEACEKYNRDQAYDPDAVKFRNMEAKREDSENFKGYSVTGEMNGKNKFGAYVGFEKINCSVNDDNEVTFGFNEDATRREIERKLGIDLGN